MKTCRFQNNSVFLWLLAAVNLSSVLHAGNLLFDIKEARITLKQDVEIGTARAEKLDSGRLKFTLTGQAGARAGWFFPIDVKIVSQCEISVALSAHNIVSAKNHANLYLVLAPRADRRKNSEENEPDNATTKNTVQKVIPVFTARGVKDTVFERLPFSTLEKTTVN